MRKNTNGFAGAVIVTILTAGFMFLLTGSMLVSYFGLGGLDEPFTAGVILFCAFLYIAVAVGVIIALYQRWQEIQGGEEDEARKY